MMHHVFVALAIFQYVTVGAYGLWVGAGNGDSTGPAAQVNMMGYAMPSQVGAGIHFRLRSRAVVFGDDDKKSRFAFVSVDNGMASYAVTREVARQLEEELPGQYSESNLCISGKHTHSGPAGFSQNVLYQVTSLGFVHQTFDAFVSGITKSIVNAHKAAKSGRTVSISRGKMAKDVASINRSPSAYLKNPSSERALYKDGNTDLDMTLVKVLGSGGEEVAMINWFAVHGTSMPNTNGLLSGDNKGFASMLFESWKNGPDVATGEGKFLALFAQTNLGDVSPNINGTFCTDSGLPCEELHSTCNGRNENCHGRGPSSDPFKSVAIIGQRQVDLAKKLWSGAKQTSVTGGDVDFRHVFRDMSKVEVVLPSGKTVKTCKASMGYSFAAGTTDGPGAFDFKQGTTSTNPFWEIIRNLLKKPSPELEACQHPKPVLLPTGEMDTPYAWDPSIVPIQLLRIGKELAIVVVPSEFTTMAGRRMRAAVRKVLVNGKVLDADNGRVVIAGLANEYSSYVVTFEEYQIQRYEGASTIFGPHTLQAYIQIATELAQSMVNGTHPDKGLPPPDLMDKQKSLLPGPLFDFVLPGKRFGDVETDVNKLYRMGEGDKGELVIKAVFHAANPRNDMRLGGTFTTVEKKGSDNKWKVIRTDNDFDTRFHWKIERELLNSKATVEWRPAQSLTTVQDGTYRLGYSGDQKTILGDYHKFQGHSSEFSLEGATTAANQEASSTGFFEMIRTFFQTGLASITNYIL